MTTFQIAHDKLINAGYPEGHSSEWRVKIEDYDNPPLIVPHWYECGTRERTNAVVRALLNYTDIYEVTVFSPYRNPVSFHGRFGDTAKREWAWYFGAPGSTGPLPTAPEL